MKEQQRKELIELIGRFSASEELMQTAIPDLYFYKSTVTNIPLPSVYCPSLCIIVQGSKEVLLGERLYHYDHSECLIASVDLPVIGRITKASESAPYMVIKIDININLLSKLLIQTQQLTTPSNKATSGLFIGNVSELLGDAVLRLVRLLDTPEDIPVLSSQVLREVYYRVLRSEYGNSLAQIALNGSYMQRISKAIRKLKEEFYKTITVSELAELSGMGISTLHAHFKAVTSMSPVQFQKSIRLMEARNLMLTKGLDAASASYRVGYESPSQFSREYTRMFGHPPGRDISRLKE